MSPNPLRSITCEAMFSDRVFYESRTLRYCRKNDKF